jgi:hypothetical protein
MVLKLNCTPGMTMNGVMLIGLLSLPGWLRYQLQSKGITCSALQHYQQI